MTWYDWLILILPVCFVMAMGIRTRRYVRGVSDFLSAGRLCGRYVISVGTVANVLSIIGLVTTAEVHYKTGFALHFWSGALMPIGIMFSLTGYCTYRFRETRAMSLGQFLEMRYSRPFRIYAAALRSIAEMVANMIMPAIAARFFIRMLDLPDVFHVFGVPVSTFVALMVLFLTLAVSLICCGGTLALIVTDTIQGMILYPILICFIVFLLHKFSVSREIIPVMANRVTGESFLNPYDISGLRDFNLFTLVIVPAYAMVMNEGIWIGAGYSTAARTPHEQKMAGVLGRWRGSITTLFCMLVTCGLLTFLTHPNFAGLASGVRRDLAVRAAADVFKDDPHSQSVVVAAVATTEPGVRRIGIDPPLSQLDNPDNEFLETIHEALLKDARERVALNTPPDPSGATPLPEGGNVGDAAVIDAEGLANDAFQQCRTLFHQLSLATTMRALLPPGLFGLFTLLLFLAMLSTDDTRIYSAALTIAQDVVLPLKRKPFTPRGHLWMIRIVAICIGVFFLFGSYYMKQLDYIYLFSELACSVWVSGAGPVMLFGLYSRFGTAQGAWAALGTSTIGSLFYILIQRNWADIVYPAIAKAGLVDNVDRALRVLSSPFGSWIEWKMDAVRCPVNTVEFMFFLMLLSLALYVVVSKLTCKVPFDLDRMLHRKNGKLFTNGNASASPSSVSGESNPINPVNPVEKHSAPLRLRVKNVLSRLVGITPEYTRGDRIIAWGVFLHSFGFSFVGCFLLVIAWNAVTPWPIEWWGRYFVIVNFAVPGVVAAISTVWFGIGGAIDLRRLFRDLAARREIDVRDDGRVENHVSLADKEKPKTAVPTAVPLSDQSPYWAGPGYWDRRHAAKLAEIAAGPKEYDCVLVGDSITHNWEGWSDPADIAVVTAAYARGELKFPNGPGRAVWEELRRSFRLLNLGIGGDCTQNVLWRLDHGELDGYRTRFVAIMIGTNNVDDTPEDRAEGIRAILEKVSEKQPTSTILLSPIFPRGATPDDPVNLSMEKTNAIIRGFTDGRRIVWLDFNAEFLDADGTLPATLFPDSLHPLEEGYRIWATALKRVISNSSQS